MWDINQRLVCINGKFDPGIFDIFAEIPKEGQYYTVRDIVPAQTFSLEPTCGVLLNEIVTKPNKHGIEPAWNPARFRELDELMNEEVERNIAMIEAMIEDELDGSPETGGFA